MFSPKVLKSEYVCFRDLGANGDLAWDVIRSDLGKGQDLSVWEISGPVWRGKEPVQLLKEGV